MVKLMKTGIKGFDDFLGGGIKEGSAVLLLSPPIIETRLLCLEYIHRGIEAEEPGLIVTTDNSPEDLKERASEYNWDLDAGEKKEMLKWIDVYSSRAGEISEIAKPEIVRRINRMSLADLVMAEYQSLREFPHDKKCYRLVFNSLSSILIHHFIEGQQGPVIRLLETSLPKLRAKKATSIFTLTKGIHDYTLENTLKHMFDGTIEIDDNLNVTAVGLSTGSHKGPVRMVLEENGFEFKAISKKE